MGTDDPECLILSKAMGTDNPECLILWLKVEKEHKQVAASS